MSNQVNNSTRTASLTIDAVGTLFVIYCIATAIGTTLYAYFIGSLGVPPSLLYWIIVVYLLVGLALAQRATRGHTVALVMCVYLIMAGTDLGLTIAYVVGGPLTEANPVANWVIVRSGWQGLVVYKVLLTGVPVLFLLAIRHRRSAACAAAIVAVCCSVLGATWASCLALLFP